jgi:hypothetical protein
MRCSNPFATRTTSAEDAGWSSASATDSVHSSVATLRESSVAMPLGQPALAHPGFAEEQDQVRPAPGDGAVDGVADDAHLGVAPDERGLLPAGPVAGWQQRRHRSPGLDRLFASLGRQGADGLVIDDLPRRRVGRRADQHGSRFGPDLQALRRVHDVAHRRVLGAGTE